MNNKNMNVVRANQFNIGSGA